MSTPAVSELHPGLQGPVVTSAQSRRLKEAAKLHARTWRAKSKRFLIEGQQAVGEALAHEAEVRPARVTVNGAAGGRPAGALVDLWATAHAARRHPELLAAAAAGGVRIRQAEPEALAGVADTVASQGLVGVCEHLDVELSDVLTRDARLVVVLSQVRDPGNLGTVLRVADAAGADAVVCTSSSVDVYNPKAVRATAGSLFHVPVVTGVGLPEVVELGRARGLQVLAADGHPPAHDLHVPWESGLDLTRRTMWVFGNEAWGLPEADRALADAAVAVPIYGRAESLNLATAASVCIYESARSLAP
ncbi:RNA methyltransferase [Brevibacterium sp. 5221]|uniref:RNA methyltransferase n=1 Tax=Brevibacterium rongguiense TaxID=2695267 RepID=A0A6N9H695_9MICO|nr:MULTISPECIES: RNA methyltransferase [Brevibacterium]MYM19469.1 RNA methyltransferase [Brevibacterium rongguiense]WAL41195.1 RNA methyltransferase [Brevibacterium sp. BRM-1]